MFTVARPHFPLVFPADLADREAFIREVADRAAGVQRIHFEIKCATVNKDAFLDHYHLLLVPDQGYSSIVKLHDRLYSRSLQEHLRLDIDFIPHIGIANSRDKYKIRQLANDWNRRDFSISGTIAGLTVVDFSHNILTDLHQIRLV